MLAGEPPLHASRKLCAPGEFSTFVSPVGCMHISVQALFFDPCVASRAMNSRCFSGPQPPGTTVLRGTGVKSSSAAISGSAASSAKEGRSSRESLIDECEANQIQIGQRKLGRPTPDLIRGSRAPAR
jgi:hypothetical protein